MVRGSKKSEEEVAEAKNGETKAKKPIAKAPALAQKTQKVVVQPIRGGVVLAPAESHKKATVSKNTKSFGRNINTAKAEPRLAKKRKQLLDKKKIRTQAA